MKPCIKCGEIKSLDEFYPHKRMKDGHLNMCKSCAVAATGKWQRENRERKRASGRRYIRSAAGLTLARERKRREQKELPEKIRARAAVERALADGRLVRQPCEECASSERVHAHHPDYSQPLEVKWLCATHHRAEHQRIEW